LSAVTGCFTISEKSHCYNNIIHHHRPKFRNISVHSYLSGLALFRLMCLKRSPGHKRRRIATGRSSDGDSSSDNDKWVPYSSNQLYHPGDRTKQQRTNTRCRFLLLPLPHLERIVEFLLDYNDISRLMLISKTFHHLVNEPRFRSKVVFRSRFWACSHPPGLEWLKKILLPYSQCGNPSATHFLGMAIYFCSENEKRHGIKMLLEAAKRGHLDSIYDAALILRKCNPALFTRLLKRASFLGHMPSSIEQGHRHVDKIINETKMNPIEVFQKQQKASIYSYMTEFFMQNRTRRTWCSTGCGRSRSLLNDGPRLPLRMCSRCYTERYCSRLCQVVSWDSHKVNCHRISEQRQQFNSVQQNIP